MEDYSLDTFDHVPIQRIIWIRSLDERMEAGVDGLLHLAIVRQNRTIVRTNDIEHPTVAIITSWEVTGANNKETLTIAERRW